MHEDLPDFLLHDEDSLLVYAVVKVHPQRRAQGSELNSRHRDDCDWTLGIIGVRGRDE